jgi:hypothetical protein
MDEGNVVWELGLVSCVWVGHVYHMKHLPCYLNLGEADKARSLMHPSVIFYVAPIVGEL